MFVFSVLEQVDIELPEDLPLREVHNIGETLQNNLEKLPEVERAFVHLDFESKHKPEHSVPTRLPNTEPWFLQLVMQLHWHSPTFYCLVSL